MRNLKVSIAELELEVAESQSETARLLALYETSRQKTGRRRDALRALQELDAEADEASTGQLTAEMASKPKALPADLKSGAKRTTRRHTQDDILSVMKADPRPEWSKSELAVEFGRRGWTDHMKKPEAAIGHAADRLFDDRRLLRPSPGRYALPVAMVPTRWATDIGIVDEAGNLMPTVPIATEDPAEERELEPIQS